MQDAEGPDGLWDWRSLPGCSRTFGGLSAHQEWGQPQLWLCQGVLFSEKAGYLNHSTGTWTRLLKTTHRAPARAMTPPHFGQSLVGCSGLSLAPGQGMYHHAAPATMQGVTQVIVPALPARARCNYYY